MKQLPKVPILVLAFNRADHVEQAMQAIRDYRPERLYLECDGARPHKKGEKEAVELTRRTMLDQIDWPCKVNTLFREENLGCAKAVSDAISWFFENEECGVIIEDDVIVSQDFFKLCEDLLVRYKDKDEIMEISAENRSRGHHTDFSYTYSLCYRCWGWATWRRAWNKMDMSMSAVTKLSIIELVGRLGIFQGCMMYYYLKSAYKHLPTFNSWATRWFLSIYDNNGLVISPSKNLALNIGMDGGVHYQAGDDDPYDYLKLNNLEWPLKYNDSIIVDKKQKKQDADDFFRVRMIGLKKKIRNILHINHKSNFDVNKKNPTTNAKNTH